jgi:hypothetical protein
MTADEFRELALSLPETEERSHMGHPDFRVARKIFAAIAPDEEKGMVKLTIEQQRLFIRSEPKVFVPVNGAWGRRGYTYILLANASEPSVRQALIAAWRNTASKKLADRLDSD